MIVPGSPAAFRIPARFTVPVTRVCTVFFSPYEPFAMEQDQTCNEFNGGEYLSVSLTDRSSLTLLAPMTVRGMLTLSVNGTVRLKAAASVQAGIVMSDAAELSVGPGVTALASSLAMLGSGATLSVVLSRPVVGAPLLSGQVRVLPGGTVQLGGLCVAIVEQGTSFAIGERVVILSYNGATRLAGTNFTGAFVVKQRTRVRSVSLASEDDPSSSLLASAETEATGARVDCDDTVGQCTLTGLSILAEALTDQRERLGRASSSSTKENDVFGTSPAASLAAISLYVLIFVLICALIIAPRKRAKNAVKFAKDPAHWKKASLVTLLVRRHSLAGLALAQPTDAYRRSGRAMVLLMSLTVSLCVVATVPLLKAKAYSKTGFPADRLLDVVFTIVISTIIQTCLAVPFAKKALQSVDASKRILGLQLAACMTGFMTVLIALLLAMPIWVFGNRVQIGSILGVWLLSIATAPFTSEPLAQLFNVLVYGDTHLGVLSEAERESELPMIM